MLYLDCRMLQGSGISTYLLNLIRELQSNNNHQKLNYLVHEYSRVISHHLIILVNIVFQEIYSVSEQIFYPSILRKEDVLHVPHYNVPLRFPGKLIVTVHDLCHLVMKEFLKDPQKDYIQVYF